MGNKKILLASIDYFTKWVEAEMLTQIRKVGVIRFIRKKKSYQGLTSLCICIRQYNSICGPKSQKLVGAAEDQILQLNTELPSVQRAS